MPAAFGTLEREEFAVALRGLAVGVESGGSFDSFLILLQIACDFSF
jgi:hypothetical protein